MRPLALATIAALLSLPGCNNNSATTDGGAGSDLAMSPGGGDLAMAAHPDLAGGPQPDLVGAPQVAVSGTITQASMGMGGNPPLAGATVSILGANPPVQTTTASDGTFTLMATAGSTIFIHASAPTYFDGQVGVVVLPAGLSGIDMNLIPAALVQQVTMALSPPLTLDPTKGIVNVNFQNTNNAGGYGATISAAHDMAFTFKNNMPQYGSMTVPMGDNSLVFPNVAAGTTTVQVTTPAGSTCTPSAPTITNYPVTASTFTFINYQCM